ncbi:efflux RND transporter periplasmic adaptor subunit [Paracoccus xiamenensis]|uniref:efflux RND transporter periplasmic adaptor subunit n=1 Tax=Paracoccus xiamenensis TaxID=2714901 RepID=UPI00140B7B80|nr:efflux RND transporter periplasmic adaptor subunit [Paracoccus xiamenensis]NHF71752.1 efflux RND transporter periplasmic adaptor subunit [Paracoccus xiamenensis]
MPRFPSTALAAFLALTPITAGHAQMPPPGGETPQALSVGTITLAVERVPLRLNLAGVAVASEDAQIRPQVGGVVQEILYKPSQALKVGDPMFQVDATSYQAALAVAEANLASANAARDEAQANADRYGALAGRGVTQAESDSARSTLLQAEAAVAVAEAEVKTAQFNLNNATIKSPIDGQASVPEVSVGDLVTSGQSDELATVTKLDPIYADLADTSAQMLRLRAMFSSGTLQPGDNLGVQLILENGEALSGEGQVISVGEQVSTSTGTFNVRVEIANPDREVLPGMFVQAELTFGTIQAVLVPQIAGTAQADGTVQVYLVEGGKAVARRVEPTGTTDSAWIIPRGLDAGAVLIVDNRDNLRDGIEVAPVAVTVATGGIVQTAEGAAPESTAADAAASEDAAATAPAAAGQ